MDGTLLILVLLVLMYVVLFLPRQRQAARQRAMQAALGPGDEIVTIGGLHGTVTAITDDAVHIEVSPGVEVRFVREAVARRLTTEQADHSPADVVDGEDRDGEDPAAEDHDGDTGGASGEGRPAT